MLAISVALALAGCGEKHAEREKKPSALYKLGKGGIENHVTNEMIEPYAFTKKQGAFIDRCINASAGIEVSALQQAKGEEIYKKWKLFQSSGCIKAGLPNM